MISFSVGEVYHYSSDTVANQDDIGCAVEDL
jgi:hypothetical protein